MSQVFLQIHLLTDTSFQEHSFSLKVEGLKNNAKWLKPMWFRGEMGFDKDKRKRNLTLKCVQLVVSILCCAKVGK